MKQSKRRFTVNKVNIPFSTHRQRLTLKRREMCLLLGMVRNTPAENQRLRRRCALQRGCMRSAMAAARRFSRRVAREPIALQRDIRQIQNSPFYNEHAAISVLISNSKKFHADYKWQLKLEF